MKQLTQWYILICKLWGAKYTWWNFHFISLHFWIKKLRTTLLTYGLLGGKVIQNGNNSWKENVPLFIKAEIRQQKPCIWLVLLYQIWWKAANLIKLTSSKCYYKRWPPLLPNSKHRDKGNADRTMMLLFHSNYKSNLTAC